RSPNDRTDGRTHRSIPPSRYQIRSLHSSLPHQHSVRLKLPSICSSIKSLNSNLCPGVESVLKQRFSKSCLYFASNTDLYLQTDQRIWNFGIRVLLLPIASKHVQGTKTSNRQITMC